MASMTGCWRIYVGNIKTGTHSSEISDYCFSMGVKILEAEIASKSYIASLDVPVAMCIDVEYSAHEKIMIPDFWTKGIKVRSCWIKKQRALVNNVNELCISLFDMHGYNCSMPMLLELLKTNDIVAVQEHWLHESNIGIIGYVNNDFDIVYASAMDNDKTRKILFGRPYDGIAILWQKNAFNVKVYTMENNSRCIGYFLMFVMIYILF